MSATGGRDDAGFGQAVSGRVRPGRDDRPWSWSSVRIYRSRDVAWRRFVGLFVAVDRHGSFPFCRIGRAHRGLHGDEKAGGRAGLAPPERRRQRPQRRREDGGRPAILPRDCKSAALGGATENSRLPPLHGRTACRRVALSRRPWSAALSGKRRGSGIDGRTRQAGRTRPSSPIPLQTLVLKNRITSSGASWIRKAARSALMSEFRRSSLKSPTLRGEYHRLDFRPTAALSKQSCHRNHRPAGSLSRTT